MQAESKIINNFYINNLDIFKRNAHYVLKIFYSIPADEDDLISECLQQLLRKAKIYIPTIELSMENYLLSNIKFIMFTYCRSLSKKNNAILNNYLNFELVENICSNSYNSWEINLGFLTKTQREIFQDIYVDNLSIRQSAVKKTTTSNFIKNEIKKIKKNINSQIDNFVD